MPYAFRISAVPLHWLPVGGRSRDPVTGFYAIARKPDGTLEACSAPGLWHQIAPEEQARYESMLERMHT